LELADSDYNIPGAIDVNLGANIYGHLLVEELRRGRVDAPVAQHGRRWDGSYPDLRAVAA